MHGCSYKTGVGCSDSRSILHAVYMQDLVQTAQYMCFCTIPFIVTLLTLVFVIEQCLYLPAVSV